ncbi:MAG: Lrp/AsnC family transcriptional regulator [Jatrophihabitans sp.]|uniref:Lrp/AsnC family transcriptional regulator n=1 Tax=Jatrophihabitans sp. TaxID=1932789 RepID=UPI003F81CD09
MHGERSIPPQKISSTPRPTRRGSAATVPAAPRAKEVRRPLDDVDRTLVTLLAEDARMPNNALAEAAGIAPSTCLARVRALRESGVIRGYHADVDPAALGRGLQAMIAVRLQSHARGHIPAFMASIATLPEVLNVFFLGGADDFLVHIAAHDTEDLRNFVVVNLSSDPDVALTETSLIFDHVRGAPLR